MLYHLGALDLSFCSLAEGWSRACKSGRLSQLHSSLCRWLSVLQTWPQKHHTSGRTFIFCCSAGTLPGSWANLTLITALWLENNSFSGQLPVEWGVGAFYRIYLLNLSMNAVSPSSITRLLSCSTQLQPLQCA